jgi:hypothetical protein
MKNNHAASNLKYFVPVFLVFNLFVSCQSDHAKLSTAESKLVKDSVSQMVANISHDVSNKGPVAWLNYFEDKSGFFMASGGQLAFKDYTSAKVFTLDTLIKSVPHIKLQWNNLSIDPLTPDLASIGADFHEELTYANGTTQNIDGYFTGTAQLGTEGGKLRNLHWSIKPTGK